jgi:hypothetical protein
MQDICLLLLVYQQVSTIEGLRVPPMPTENGGVPSPLDHQALCLVIALTRDFVV